MCSLVLPQAGSKEPAGRAGGWAGYVGDWGWVSTGGIPSASAHCSVPPCDYHQPALRAARPAVQQHPALQRQPLHGSTACSPPSQRLLRGSSAGQEQSALDSGLADQSPCAAAFQAASQRESLWARREQPTREVQSTGRRSYLRRASAWMGKGAGPVECGDPGRQRLARGAAWTAAGCKAQAPLARRPSGGTSGGRQSTAQRPALTSKSPPCSRARIPSTRTGWAPWWPSCEGCLLPARTPAVQGEVWAHEGWCAAERVHAAQAQRQA